MSWQTWKSNNFKHKIEIFYFRKMATHNLRQILFCEYSVHAVIIIIFFTTVQIIIIAREKYPFFF